MAKKNQKKQEKTIYGIIGLGRFGYALATALAASGAELMVLDNDEEKVREAREYTENAFVVHSLDKKSLAETGIASCDVAVVCIGDPQPRKPRRKKGHSQGKKRRARRNTRKTRRGGGLSRA